MAYRFIDRLLTALTFTLPCMLIPAWYSWAIYLLMAWFIVYTIWLIWFIIRD